MRPSLRSGVLPKASLPLALLCILLAALWLAGGASRGDALGQVVVRGVAVGLLIVAALWGKAPPRFREFGPVWLVLLAAIVLAVLQLVPLPPPVWQAFPGRDLLTEAAAASGQAQPWRPWSIVPGATINAALSLIVPLAALTFATTMDDDDRSRLSTVLLAMVTASTIIGLLQFSGAGFDNLLINDVAGEVGGTFANRNHMALFLAIGCVLAPPWAFQNRKQFYWRGPTALGLVLLFFLTILATGSRTGLVLGVVALALGAVMVRGNLQRTFRRFPRWVLPAVLAAVLVLFALFVFISVSADRAVAFDRLFVIDQGEDMRGRALPTIVEMIRLYFPLGAGMGSFDPVFRIHEPTELLRVTYFNHAHDDLIEIGLEAGLPGFVLLAAGLLWWVRASVRAWRGGTVLARTGSTILLLIVIASGFDYPARTPIVMATAIIAACWLSASSNRRYSSPLPQSGQHL